MHMSLDAKGLRKLIRLENPVRPIYCRDGKSRQAHLLLAPFPTCGRGPEILVSLPYLTPWRNGRPGSWPESKHVLTVVLPNAPCIMDPDLWLNLAWPIHYILFESFTNFFSEQILMKPPIIPEVCFGRTHQRQAYKTSLQVRTPGETKAREQVWLQRRSKDLLVPQPHPERIMFSFSDGAFGTPRRYQLALTHQPKK